MRRAHRLNLKGQAGFTIPELLSVMIISLLFSGLVMYFTFEYWRLTATLSSDLDTYVSRLTAGDRLRDAINSSSGLISQNSIPDTHTGAADPANGTGNYWVPLHAIPETITIGAAGTYTPVLYFQSPSVDHSSNVILNGVQPYNDEYVLYMDGTTKQLRMRVLANASATGDRNKTTCPTASVTITCPIDRLISDNVSSVALRYFSRSGNPMDYTSIVDPLTGNYAGPDLPAVEVLELTLTLNKKSIVHGGADTTNQTIIRVALRNA